MVGCHSSTPLVKFRVILRYWPMPSRLLSCWTYLPQYMRGSLRQLLVEVIGIDRALAAIDFDHRSNEGDDVVTDGLNERRLLDNQPIGQLDEHFGAAGFGRVNAAVRPVERLAEMDQFAGLLIGDFSRITEPGENVFVLVELFAGGFVGDGAGDLVAVLFGLTE